MRGLAKMLAHGRAIRAVGFDDAPFDKNTDGTVQIAGVVCAGTRFEGLLWGDATRDGEDATEVLAALLSGSKFHPQVHVVLLDGLAIGGLNLVDLPSLSRLLDRPCVAVMRKPPDLAAVERVVARFPDAERRRGLLRAAGPIHQLQGHVFQVAGEEPELVARVLTALTDRGQVPEPLRLAHLIGSAVKLGVSGKRA